MPAHTTPRLPIPQSGSFWKWLLLNQRATVLLIIFILISDLLLFALHFEATLRQSPNPLLYLDTDRGYAEMFQYLKLLFILMLLALFVVERRSWSLSAWIPVFLYLVYDDALHIHEPLGTALATYLNFQPTLGFNAHDFGELAISIAAGLLFLPLLLVAYSYASLDERWVFRVLTLLIGFLALLGVFLDFIHSLFVPPSGNLDWFIVFEDGGEMIVVTFITLFVLRLNLDGGGRALEYTSSSPA